MTGACFLSEEPMAQTRTGHYGVVIIYIRRSHSNQGLYRWREKSRNSLRGVVTAGGVPRGVPARLGGSLVICLVKAGLTTSSKLERLSPAVLGILTNESLVTI